MDKWRGPKQLSSVMGGKAKAELMQYTKNTYTHEKITKQDEVNK